MDEGAAPLPSPPVRADGDRPPTGDLMLRVEEEDRAVGPSQPTVCADGDRPPTGDLMLRVEEEDSAVDDLITWSQLNRLNIMSPLIPSPCRR